MPYQPFTLDIRVYYYMHMGMYLSLLITISRDHKRKDFTEVLSLTLLPTCRS